MPYIWQQPTWPNFTWDSQELLELLGKARKAQGQVIARAEHLGLEAQTHLFVDEALTTAAIEGETLDRLSVRSSVAKRLGLQTAGLSKEEWHIDGLVEMLIDATVRYPHPLTPPRLHGWHAGLFPTAHSGIRKITTGTWRQSSEPMRVISGPIGNVKIHFEAPPSQQVAQEIKQFLAWWKAPPKNLDGILRAAIAHLWFVTIHPYDDGNGRIGRALIDMALAQDEGTGRRLYSLSTQILRERKAYYSALEFSQSHPCNITPWLKWFLEMYTRAITGSETLIQKSLWIAQFWKERSTTDLNPRQLKVLQKLLESEPGGFEGGLTNKKYVSMTKTSRETAKRDLASLEEHGFLTRNPGRGRSISYALNLKKLGQQ